MDDRTAQAVLHLQAALSHVDCVARAGPQLVSYETMQRSGFRHKGTRAYTMADAKRDAATAARELRTAWELLDHVTNA